MIDVKTEFPLERVLAIVRLLRQDGYMQGVDFDFRFIPEQHDSFSYQSVVQKHTIFSFYDEELAMMFTLKYSS